MKNYKQIATDALINSQRCPVIEVKVNDLINYESACGHVGNKNISQERVDFLISMGIEYVLIGVSDYSPTEIGNMALPIPVKGNIRNIRKFCEMDDGVSLNWDEADISKEWPILESE